MKGELSDQRLMGELASGNDWALGELMSRWEGRVLCFIDRMCGYLGRSEDLYQDIWARIFIFRSRYDQGRPFGPFLFAVAANCCRTAIARTRTVPCATDASSTSRALERADEGPSPLTRMISQEQCQALQYTIYMLPETQRAVVLLYMLLDGDYSQIAQSLDISRATARSHMSHALKALRGRLGRAAQRPRVPSKSEVSHE